MRADRGWLRTLRAGVFAGAAVALAAAAHELGGGSVSAVGAVAGFLLLLLVARPLAGRARRLPGTAGATALSQLGLHLVFTGAGGSCSASGHAAHAAHVAVHCAGAPVMTHDAGPAMLVAHALAGLALALLLTHGERGLWAFLALLGLRPPPVGIVVHPVPAGLLLPAPGVPSVESPAPAISPRGPPAFLRARSVTHSRRIARPCPEPSWLPSPPL